MDIDLLMMHMDKLQEFSDVNQIPLLESNGFMNQQPFNNNISFVNSPPIIHHQELSAMDLLTNSRNDHHQFAAESDKRNSMASMAAMREMIFRIAAMQPIQIDPESVKPPKRRNVKISKDPQSVAARHRREKISERIRILQRLVPGGTKMDTASMLDEAIHYVKFLKNQIQSLERAAAANRPVGVSGVGFPVPMSTGSYLPMMVSTKSYQATAQNVQHYADA